MTIIFANWTTNRLKKVPKGRHISTQGFIPVTLADATVSTQDTTVSTQS